MTGRRGQTSSGRRRRLLPFAAAALLVLLGPFVALIKGNEASAERALNARFENRAALTASFTRAYIDDVAAREEQQATRLLAGVDVDQALFDQVVSSMGLEAALLLDGDGRLLHIWPHRPELLGTDMTVEYAHLRAAVGGEVGVSEMVPSAAEGLPITAIAVPFQSAAGRRVFSGALRPTTTPLGAYFTSAIPIRGGTGFLIDGSGDVLAAGQAPDTAPAELDGLRDGVTHLQGEEGSVTAVVAPVRGTPWHVVLTAPSHELHAPVSHGRWAPWLLLAALAGCGIGVIVLVVRLGDARAHADQTARTDALTGLPNRRAMDELLERAVARARRHQEPLAVLMVDLDHFKRINDRHGHDVGDLVLREAATALRTPSRADDTVARWGGEEFLVLLPGTGIDGAARAAERLRAAVEAVEIPGRPTPIEVTASIGMALLGDGSDVHDLVRAADDAVYRAKENGRNLVEVCSSAVQRRPPPVAVAPPGAAAGR